MALNLTASRVVVPTSTPRAARVAPAPAPVQARRAVTNAPAARQMLTWTPYNNKFFETLSYLPPLSEDEIARQVAYITRNGWTPCLEFADAEHAYIDSRSCNRFGPVTSNYNDNSYWTMWKLPMFGCTDPSQVQMEINSCKKTFPHAFLRIVGFDSVRQVQVAGFLVHRPSSASDYQDPGTRSVGAMTSGYGGQPSYDQGLPPPQQGYGAPPPPAYGHDQGPPPPGYGQGPPPPGYGQGSSW